MISNHVPPECEKARDLIRFLPLEAGPDRWAEEVLRSAKIVRRDTLAEIQTSGFDIRENALKLQQFYLDHWQV